MGLYSQQCRSYGEEIRQKIVTLFPKVGDLSSHPINEHMQKLVVKSSEVTQMKPKENRIKTEYAIEFVADKRMTKEQLGAYAQRG